MCPYPAGICGAATSCPRWKVDKDMGGHCDGIRRFDHHLWRPNGKALKI